MQRWVSFGLACTGGALLSAVAVALALPLLVDTLRNDYDVGCWDTASGPTMCSDGSVFLSTGLLLFVVFWVRFGLFALMVLRFRERLIFRNAIRTRGGSGRI